MPAHFIARSAGVLNWVKISDHDVERRFRIGPGVHVDQLERDLHAAFLRQRHGLALRRR